MFKTVNGEKVSVDKWKQLLQKDFPFLEQDPNDDHNIYKKFGFECSGGWYHLLWECCEAIVARYAEEGIEIDNIDFVPVQIKEKFGTLRFYYGYTDAPCGITAFDNLASGESIRFEPETNGGIDDAKAKLRQDIRSIVSTAEEKSKHTCEMCGAEGKLRNDSEVGIHWVRTLCDSCHEDRIRKAIEKREKRRNMSPKEILDEIKENLEEKREEPKIQINVALETIAVNPLKD